MKRVVALAASMLAAVVLSACGSSGPALGSPPHGPGTILLVGTGPSGGLGVDNTDLLAASPSGHVVDLTSSAAAEDDAAWSADGSRVAFVRHSTSGQKNGGVALQVGIYVWSPGHGTPKRIASCSKYCYGNEFAWSPDDRQIAFTSPENGGVKVMNADGSDVHLVCECGGGIGGLRWSPDGRKLVFSNQYGWGWGPVNDPPSSVWIANADGSGAKRLTQQNCTSLADERDHDCARDTAPAWSPDGRLVAFSRWRLGRFPLAAGPTGAHGPTGTTKQSGPTQPSITTSLEVMRADGSHLRSIYDCSERYCDQFLPSVWAPDGKAIAYAPFANDSAPSSFRITTLAGKTTTIRTCAGSRCLSPTDLTWSPTGSQLAFIVPGPWQRDSAWVVDRDGGALHRIADDVECCLAWVEHIARSGARIVPTVPTAHLHLSGTIAYDNPAGGPDSQIRLLSLGGGGGRSKPRVVLRQSLEPSWSPDGQEIAFGGLSATPNTNIYVADRNGKNIRVLTRFRRGATQPAWSPDGRTIAFEAEGEIRLMSAAGGRSRTLVTNGVSPSWSPSGSELVFERHLAPRSEALFTIRADGTGLHRLTNLPEFQRSPVWSPDGKEIAFEWLTPNGDGLYLIRPDGTHLRRVTTAPLPPGKPAWSPDSRYLVVISARGRMTSTQVRVIDVKSGRVAIVATVPGYAANPSWSSR